MIAAVETARRHAHRLGIQVCHELDPRRLEPEERIRALCAEDKCQSYGKHHLCPPLVGSLELAREQLAGYRSGVLLQWSRELDVQNDRPGVEQSKIDFHLLVLELEGALAAAGIAGARGLIGGNCSLCTPCTAASGEPCPEPDRARPSLEALGVDVMALLAGFGLDNRFHPDRVTWTGCVLFR
jgi:predicted metal-binding protein